jgi:hypothetical protein
MSPTRNSAELVDSPRGLQPILYSASVLFAHRTV